METTVTNKSFVDRNISRFVLRRAGATTYWPPYIIPHSVHTFGTLMSRKHEKFHSRICLNFHQWYRTTSIYQFLRVFPIDDTFLLFRLRFPWFTLQSAVNSIGFLLTQFFHFFCDRITFSIRRYRIQQPNRGPGYKFRSGEFAELLASLPAQCLDIHRLPGPAKHIAIMAKQLWMYREAGLGFLNAWTFWESRRLRVSLHRGVWVIQ
jgi:hypothetical protein